MYVVTLTLDIGGAEGNGPVVGAAADLVWAHALPEDRLEHVHVRAVAGAVEMTLFLLGDSQAGAELDARRICRRLLAVTPAFAGWQLIDDT